MTQPTVLPGTDILILVGDGGSPEVFTQPCGLTTKDFTLSASTNSTLIPDCDDPEAPAWEAKTVNALSMQVTGTGVMATESHDVWRDWFLSADSKHCHIVLGGAGDGLGYWSGSFILSSLKFGGERGQKITLDITLDNDGAVVFVDVA